MPRPRVLSRYRCEELQGERRALERVELRGTGVPEALLLVDRRRKPLIGQMLRRILRHPMVRRAGPQLAGLRRLLPMARGCDAQVGQHDGRGSHGAEGESFAHHHVAMCLRRRRQHLRRRAPRGVLRPDGRLWPADRQQGRRSVRVRGLHPAAAVGALASSWRRRVPLAAIASPVVYRGRVVLAGESLVALRELERRVNVVPRGQQLHERGRRAVAQQLVRQSPARAVVVPARAIPVVLGEGEEVLPANPHLKALVIDGGPRSHLP